MAAVQRLLCVLLVAVAVTSAPACVGSSAPPVRRVLAGRVRTGEWVSPYAYEVFMRAELARAAGQLARAIELHREAIASAPDDPFLLANLADTLAEAGRLDDAAHVIERGLADHPASEALWLSRGDLLWRRTDHAGALRAYGEASRVAPSSDEGPRAIAEALERNGRTSEAALVLDRFIRRGRSTGPLVRVQLRLAAIRGDHETIARALRALGRAGGGRRSDLRALARAARADDPALAATLYRFLVHASPNDAALRVEALRAALDIGDVTTVEALTAATAGLPPALEARALLLRGAPEDALRLLVELAELPSLQVATAQTDPLELRELRARALALAGHDAEAITALASIASGTTAYPASRILLADLLERVAGPNAALSSLRAASGAAPHDPSIAWALVRRLADSGDGAGARALIESFAEPDRALLAARWADLAGDDAAAPALWRAVDPSRATLVERQRVLAERALATHQSVEAATRMERAVGWAPLDAPLAARAAELVWAHDPARAILIAREAITITDAPAAVLRRLEVLAARTPPAATPRPAHPHPHPSLRARRRGTGSP